MKYKYKVLPAFHNSQKTIRQTFRAVDDPSESAEEPVCQSVGHAGSAGAVRPAGGTARHADPIQDGGGAWPSAGPRCRSSTASAEHVRWAVTY